MSQIEITVIGTANLNDVFATIFEQSSVDAILTTDHPSSSHGLPVVVVNGVAFGVAEIAGSIGVATSDGHLREWPLTDEQRSLLSAAKMAGYDVRNTL